MKLNKQLNKTQQLILSGLGFNLFWCLAVIGQDNYLSLLLIITMITLCFSYRQLPRILFAVACGVMLDYGLTQVQVFQFTATQFIPLWLILLWCVFSAWWLWFIRQVKLSLPTVMLLGAFSGPFSYWAGKQLGAVIFVTSTPLTLLILSMLWALYLPLITSIHTRCRRINNHSK